MNNYTYKETKAPLTGDTLWLVKDISLAMGGITTLIKKFINSNKHEDYSLSVFDTLTSQTIEIECSISEIPQIVEFIYQTEHGTPLSFIGVNRYTDSYVVGMRITQGRISFGYYTVKEGKLCKI